MFTGKSKEEIRERCCPFGNNNYINNDDTYMLMNDDRYDFFYIIYIIKANDYNSQSPSNVN